MLSGLFRVSRRQLGGVCGVRRFATAPYHAGLKRSEMTTSMDFSKESQTIPIFRVLKPDGTMESGWQNPFSAEETVDLYKFMVRLQIWDDMFYNVQRQGRISFYIQNQGEEALQTGIGRALHKDDHIFSQYRELGVLMQKGFTAEETLSQLFSTLGDEGKGRQMPISYSKSADNIHTISTPLTTQVPHAAGAGYAFKHSDNKNRVAVTFFGEGAASEGDFHAAMNFAAVRKAQTIFVCRNNGYAISTPVHDQYSGDGIAIRGLSYGIETIRVDGNDLFASFIAFQKARKICVEKSEPVLLEMMTYRLGHHSTSDESSQYRVPGEIESWSEGGLFPIPRLLSYLKQQGLWDEERDTKIRKEAKTKMLKMMKKAEQDKKHPVIPAIFDDVYDTKPLYLQEQADELKQHLKNHPDKYNLDQFAP